MARAVDILACTSYADLPSRLIRSTTEEPKHISSYGVIAYDTKSDKTVLVRRKYNSSFVLILKGMYRNAHLPYLVKDLTDEEINTLKDILKHPNKLEAYSKLILNSEFNIEYARERLKNSGLLNILTNKGAKETEWIFPGGRPFYMEEPRKCAIREFQEETGFSIDNQSTIYLNPLIEQVHTISNLIIDRHYWVCAYSPSQRRPGVKDPMEIAEVRWVTIAEAGTLLSPTRLEILKQALSLITDKIPTTKAEPVTVSK